MIQSTVLVTGAGGAALPALIDGLHADGHRVIAVDADPNAVGLYLADRGYRIPFAAADEFVPALRRICSAEKVGVLIPLVDEELLGIAALGVELQIPMIGPVAEFTGLCLDKFELMRRMSEAGLPTPLTRLLSEGTAGCRFP